MGKFLKKHGVTLLLMGILIAGLCLLLYPTFSNWWNQFHMTEVIDSYKKAVESMSDEEKEEYLKAAEEYNEKLAEEGSSFSLSDEEQAEYDKILDLDGNGVMGYIRISKIDLDLPIYHGTTEKVLQSAIGHLAGSSFPIGGESTHAVLSGHRGLPSARLFTDLDQLQEGDTFTVTVLDRKVTYEVDQIRIVLPEEVSDLAITQGEDYMTLFTCTPYGINTHRLLIRGRRIENESEVQKVSADAVKIQRYIAVLAAAIPMLFFLLLVLLFRYRRIKPKKDLNEIREKLSEKGSEDKKQNDRNV